VLCGFINVGQEPLNVSGIYGVLADPADLSRVLMNFTWSAINEEVEPDAEATYAYRFRMPRSMPPQPLHTVFNLVFAVGPGPNQRGQRTCFNETLEYVEGDAPFNWAPVVKTALLGVAVALAVVFHRAALAGAQDVRVATGGAGAGAAPAPVSAKKAATTFDEDVVVPGTGEKAKSKPRSRA
jgi:hypothetical protein